MLAKEEIAELAEEDFLRAQFYAFLTQLLAKTPDQSLLDTMRKLDGDDTAMGTALVALSKAANETSLEALDEEFTKLFYGMGQGGEILPYGSYYLTGLLYDKPLALLRQDMDQIGVARSDENSEPEDHIAYLFEIMHGLILGRFEGAASLSDQRSFFESHIAPWAFKLFTDIESAESSTLYIAVARVANQFLKIESDAFKMTV